MAVIRVIYTDPVTTLKFTEDLDTSPNTKEERQRAVLKCLDLIEFRLGHSIRFRPAQNDYLVTFPDSTTMAITDAATVPVIEPMIAPTMITA